MNLLAPPITVEVYNDAYKVSYLGVEFLWTEAQIDDVIHFLMMARECQHNKTFFLMPAGEQFIYDEATDKCEIIALEKLTDITKIMDGAGLTAMYLEFQRLTHLHGSLYSEIHKTLKDEFRPGETMQSCIERLVRESREKKRDNES